MKLTYSVFLFFLVIIINCSNLYAIENLKKVEVFGEVTKEENVSKNIIVVTSEDLRKTRAKTLVEALQYVPGVSIVSYAPYHNAFLYIKGASPHSSIILINGVKIADPSQGAFDISQIPLMAVDRIEIIQSGDGVSYGSSAASGVINIITTTASQNTEVKGLIETGLDSSHYGELGYLGVSNNNMHRFNFFISDHGSQGYNLAYPDHNNLGEKDGFSKQSFLTTYSYNSFDALFQYNNGKRDGDDLTGGKACNGQFVCLKDIYNTDYKKETYNGYLKYNFAFKNTNHTLSLSTFNVDRLDYAGGGLLMNKSSGQDINIAYNTYIRYLDNGFVKLGLDYDLQKLSQNYANFMEVPQEFTSFNESTLAYYSIIGYRFFNALNLSAGLRYNTYNEYTADNKINYNVSMDYIFLNNYKLRANYIYNFKAPNLYELHGSYGNEQLLEEQTKGYDVGVDATLLNGNLLLNATYFKQKITNLITLDYNFNTANHIPTQEFTNIDGTYGSEGFMFFAKMPITKYFNFTTGYTLLLFNEIANRRPKNAVNTSLEFKPISDLSFVVDYMYIGNTLDGFDSTGYQKLDSYNIVNTKIEYNITNNFASYLKLTNIFNEDYQSSMGFQGAGRGAYIGLLWK